MKVPQQSLGGVLELKMTPMIDVVFLLLIFFIWTSSFEIPEFDLPSAIALPAQAGIDATDQPPLAEPFDEIVIRLSRSNAQVQIEMNQQPISTMKELRNRLAEIIAIGVQPPIIIDPSAEITMNVAVEAYDAAKRAGADRVLFAAQPE
jgi:biopolymer transport protein ExbD